MSYSIRIVLIIMSIITITSTCYAQFGFITTYAGPRMHVNGDKATGQVIDQPYSAIPDGSGGVYISSAYHQKIYRVSANGTLTIVAGNGTQGFSGDGGPATAASFNCPWGLALDSAGNLYIADLNNNRIRRVTANGVISTVAGIGTAGFSGDDGPATAAQLNMPTGVALDSSGNLYVSDTNNECIRKVIASGQIYTVVGNRTKGAGGDGGPATAAQLYLPIGIALDTSGSLYIADRVNARIRRVSTSGIITTVAGIGTEGFSGDNGPATTAQLSEPTGVATDLAGNFYIADMGNHRVRKVTAAGMITTVAGGGFAADGNPAVTAQLSQPISVASDPSGNLYIADAYAGRVRRVAPDGAISTVAGYESYGFSGDGGLATAAQIDYPSGVAVDAYGMVYFSAFERIRRVSTSGIVETFAGTSTWGFNGDDRPAVAAMLYDPKALAFDSAGNLYIADSNNNRIRKVTVGGIITTVAGSGTPGYTGDGGQARAAQFNVPTGIAVDSGGNLYIADSQNHRIRRITPEGTISTVAGNGNKGYSGDYGPATAAQLYNPVGVAVDSTGNLYIADKFNGRVRKVTAAGVISTAAGSGYQAYTGDGGPATKAGLNNPSGVAVDPAGNLYIADSGANRIRMVDATGVISTAAGNGYYGFSGDGGPAPSAQLSNPTGVALDSAGNLYIADTDNCRIRLVTREKPVVSFFPQVAAGGAYSTLFTLTNTGATPASETLRLTDQQGNPFVVRGTITDSSGNTGAPYASSLFAFAIPAGGTVFVSAAGQDLISPLTAGWASLASTGGAVSAVATYECAIGAATQMTVSVLQSQPLQFATIPVDNLEGQNKQLAYAIANSSDHTISIKLALVGQDGVVVDDTLSVTLAPGQQMARYLWQDLPARRNFRGSFVLRGQSAATFVAIGLSDKQGYISVIPLIPGKAPSIPK